MEHGKFAKTSKHDAGYTVMLIDKLHKVLGEIGLSMVNVFLPSGLTTNNPMMRAYFDHPSG
jgi:hypothetical protein